MLTTEIIDNSSCYRNINNDEKKYVRAVVIGLSYNKNELCRVFDDKFSKEEMNKINSSRVYNINFKNREILSKQLQHIRDNKDSLQEVLVNKLYSIYPEEREYKKVFKTIANDIKIQLVVYDMSDKEMFRTGKKHKYRINIMHNNDKFYILTNKVTDIIKTQCKSKIIAGYRINHSDNSIVVDEEDIETKFNKLYSSYLKRTIEI